MVFCYYRLAENLKANTVYCGFFIITRRTFSLISTSNLDGNNCLPNVSKKEAVVDKIPMPPLIVYVVNVRCRVSKVLRNPK